jgi:hypothetical protein
MSELTDRAYKFRRFDRDCRCPGLLRELADRIEYLEEELRKAQEAHCLAAGETATARGDGALAKAAAEKRAHDLTSALRHVQTELGVALSSLRQAKNIADVVLGDKKE